MRSKNKIDAADMNERYGIIRRAIKRMTGLLDSTLYASRIDEGNLELTIASCDLGALVQEVCARQLDLAPTHSIQIDVSTLPSQIMADDKLLNVVFTNLLSNAVKYAPDAPLIEVKGWSDTNMAMVSVRDRGVGITEEDLPSMFERFFRAKSAEGIAGSGVGLHISKEFVELHGGAIELDSAEGEGSTFTVYLPLQR